ncbi:15821_t:CDS:2, partial [Acaulospora colombiana]
MNGELFSPSLWFDENPKYTKENAPDAIFLMMGRADSGLVKLLEKAKQTSDLEIKKSGMIDMPGSNPPFCHYVKRGSTELRITFTVFTGYQLQSVATVMKRLHPRVPYIVVITNRDKLPEFNDTLVHKYLDLESLACPSIEIVDVDMDHMDD